MIDLSAFGFTVDPFPLVPDAAVRHWAGREELRRELVDICEGVRIDDIGVSETVIIHGEFGSGKSHALRYLETMINSDPDRYRSKAIYLRSIRIHEKITFLALYRQVIAELGADEIVKCAKAFQELVTMRERQLRDDLDRDEVIQLVEKPDGLRTKALESMPEDLLDMAWLVLGIAGGDESHVSYLQGVASIRLGDMPQKIDSDYAAAKVLGQFLALLTQPINDFPPVWNAAYLFLDEIEAIVEERAAEATRFLNALRDLIDRLPYRLCMLLTFTGDTAVIEAVVQQSFLSRLSRDYIELPDLSEEEARDFLKRHFEHFRPDGFAPENSLHPFEPEAVDAVLERTVPLTPRNMFRTLRKVLERAIKRHDLAPGTAISVELVHDILGP
jgi:ABC-type dipeptide/oligopeptide/nickel transport system ATPase component